DLPAEEFLAEIVDIGHLQPDYRLAGILERLDPSVLILISSVLQTEIDEDSVVSIDFRSPKRLAIHRDQALALFARALGQQLLEPRAQVRNPGRGDERDLVVPQVCERAQHGPQENAWVFRRRHSASAGMNHFFGAIQETPDIQTHDRARYHAEIGKR